MVHNKKLPFHRRFVDCRVCEDFVLVTLNQRRTMIFHPAEGQTLRPRKGLDVWAIPAFTQTKYIEPNMNSTVKSTYRIQHRLDSRQTHNQSLDKNQIVKMLQSLHENP